MKLFVLAHVQSAMAFLPDARYGLRVLARTPLFAMTAIVSLALGIAASTAIFSLADAMLLRPRIGIVAADSVVEIGRTVNGEGFDNFGYPLFAAMRERTTTLGGIAAYQMSPQVMSLGGTEASERVFASLVSGNYFEVLGTRAAAGRFFRPEEDRIPGAHPVVVLSHQLWQTRFERKPDIVGDTVLLNGLRYTVLGIAEPGFTGTTVVASDLWAPMAMDAHVRASDESLLANERAVWHVAIGRLKHGVSVRQARDELDAIARNYFAERGDDRASRWGIDVAVSSRVPAVARTPVVGFLAVLGALTGLVLAIACSNVAGMLLARALQRRREVATRLALGAGRRHIVNQLLTEGLVLAVAAAVVSIPITSALVNVLEAFRPGLPIPLALDLRIDARVMSFAAAVAMATAMLFASIPALQATRFDVAPALHGATATSDRTRTWLRQGLVAAQVAMALLLLVATGLFLRSLEEAASVDAGFNVEDVDAVQVDVRLAGYRGPEGVLAVEALLERFRGIAGVSAVGASRMVPLQGGGLGLGRLRAPGHVGPDGTDEVRADWDVITPDYFRVLQLPVVRGRAFDWHDREGAPFVAVVNETLANRLWPGRDPIGQQLLQRASPVDNSERPLTVVGVAKDAKYRSLGEPPRNFIYVPHAQQFLSDMTFYLRHAPGESRIAAARDVIRSFNSTLPVIFAQPLAQAAAIGLLPQRLAAWVAGTVGSVGLLLAGLGLYGLTAFVAAQRTREIAVRLALGATKGAVLRLVLREAGSIALIGGIAGVLMSIAVGTGLQSLLIGVEPIDPVTFVSAVVVLTSVLLVASLAPARRASQLDPVRALRAE